MRLMPKMPWLPRMLGGIAIAGIACASAQAAPRDAKTIINQVCGSCHVADPGKENWSRISQQRKTPEGWLMTIGRMQNQFGISISDEDRRTVVKHLADTRGLAPAETDGVRYALERRMNTVETLGSKQYQEMCARCHSAARPVLQRRPLGEWERLVHMHLSQWPSVEYSAMGRDRDWLNSALKEMAPMLAKEYPYDSKAWSDWQKSKPMASALNGRWSFSGHMPGQGDVRGVMTATHGGGDKFTVKIDGMFVDGEPFSGSGNALLYTGYEWRANVKVNGVPMRQVLALRDGTLKGRMFESAHDERGLEFAATKAPVLLAVQPGHVKAGEQAELTLVGSQLKGNVDLGAGVDVLSVTQATPEQVRVKVRVKPDAVTGLRPVKVGNVQGAQLSVYKSIDEVKVVPALAVARIGGNGASTPKVQGRFDAEAWSRDAAGKSFRVGVVPARWTVEPFDDRAKHDRDVEFAGSMQASTGFFTPGDAGPNPKRTMSANNVGNLKVVAHVNGSNKPLKAEGHLIVAVQRWNNPPVP